MTSISVRPALPHQFTIHTERARTIQKTRTAIAQFQCLVDELEPKFAAARGFFQTIKAEHEARSPRFAFAMEMAGACKPIHRLEAMDLLIAITPPRESLVWSLDFDSTHISGTDNAFSAAERYRREAIALHSFAAQKPILPRSYRCFKAIAGIMEVEADFLLDHRYTAVREIAQAQLEGYEGIRLAHLSKYPTLVAEAERAFARLQGLYRTVMNS